MSIAITEDHRALADTASDFLAEARRPRRGPSPARGAEPRSCPTFWKDLAGLGWLGLHLPEEHGGSGYGARGARRRGRGARPGRRPGPVRAHRRSPARCSPRPATTPRRRSCLPGLADGSTAGAVALGGDGRPSATARRPARPASCSAAGSPTCCSSPSGDDVAVVERAATASRSRRPPNLDPTRRSRPRHARRRRRRPCSPAPRQALVDLARVILVGRGRRAWPASAPSWPPRTPRSACSSAAPIAHVPGGEAPLRQHGRGHRAGHRAPCGTPPAPPPPAATSSRYAAAVAATLAAPGRRPVRQPQHPGARRHRYHLGARRPPLHAPGHRRCSRFLDADERRRRPHRPRPAAASRGPRPIELPPEAEPIRDEVRAFADEHQGPRRRRAAHQAHRDRLRDAALAQAVRPRGRRRRAARHRAGVRRGRRQAPGLRHHRLGHPHAHPVRQPRTRSTAGCGPRSTRRSIWCQLFSEPDAGSDAAGVKTKATRVDGGWLVNGQKVWTSGAHVRRHGLRHRAHQPRRARSTTASRSMVIDMHAEGVEVRPLQMTDGALGVQRGLLQRRVRARRRRGRPGRRRLDGRPGHARQREREHRRRPGRHVACPATR